MPETELQSLSCRQFPAVGAALGSEPFKVPPVTPSRVQKDMAPLMAAPALVVPLRVHALALCGGWEEGVKGMRGGCEGPPGLRDHFQQ